MSLKFCFWANAIATGVNLLALAIGGPTFLTLLCLGVNGYFAYQYRNYA